MSEELWLSVGNRYSFIFFFFVSLQEMEAWVNSVPANSKTIGSILGIQLKRAMTSFDIYLETETTINPHSDSVEFPTEKTIITPFRGRTQSRPFKAIPNGCNVIYTQL